MNYGVQHYKTIQYTNTTPYYLQSYFKKEEKEKEGKKRKGRKKRKKEDRRNKKKKKVLDVFFTKSLLVSVPIQWVTTYRVRPSRKLLIQDEKCLLPVRRFRFYGVFYILILEYSFF